MVHVDHGPPCGLSPAGLLFVCGIWSQPVGDERDLAVLSHRAMSKSRYERRPLCLVLVGGASSI